MQVSVPARRPPLRYDFRYGAVARDELTERELRRILARRAQRMPVAYADPQGTLELRRALAHYLRRERGLDCSAERLLITGGSQQGLDLLGRLLLDPGQQVAVEEPGYGGARGAFATQGADVRLVPADGHGLDVAALPRLAPEARLVYVTPSHQFPGGGILPLSRRLELVRWASEHAAYILEDDYDGAFRYTGQPIELLTRLDGGVNSLYLATFSKVLFPALRVGYLMLPENLIEPASRLRWLNDRHGNPLFELCLAEFIEEGHFERHLRRTRRSHGLKRAALLAAIAQHLGDRVRVQGTDAGAHLVLWLDDVAPRKLDALIARAAAQEVGIYSIARYYAKPPPRAGLLLGYTTLSPAAIEEGVRRLARLLPKRARPRKSR